jgi:nicotinate-nucleotide adenylyltransferase
MSARQTIGIFGGTFDPLHIGHLILAETACDALSLSQVLFVPAAHPPHKQDAPITSVGHRVAMVEAAIADNPRFTLSDIDIKRDGPHYTADTLQLFAEKYPDADLFFLLGGDSLHDFPTWYEPQLIIRYAKLAVMSRPGAVIDMSALEARLQGISQRVVIVEAPIIGISATLLRQRLKTNQSIRYLVPDAVEQYITQHQLYRNNHYA